MNNRDAVCCGQRIVSVGERLERTKPGEIKIAQEARRIELGGRDQRHFGGRGARCEISSRARQAADLATRPGPHGGGAFSFAARKRATPAISSSLSDRAITCMIWLGR